VVALNQPDRVLLTEAEAAELIGFSPRFLTERRYRGGGPLYVRVSARAVRYRPADLEAWAEERVRSSTSDPGPDGAA
jgi:predicted DNA-binding transcriptional regulator AlpA